MKLYQVNFQNRQMFVLADSMAAALQAARACVDEEPVHISVIAAVGHNLLMQTGYALQPAAVH